MPAPHITPDARIAALAGRQHGIVHRRDLLAAGLGRNHIAHRVRSGWLHRLHPEVFAVGHTAITLRGRWLAAVLACGPGAVLSHASSAALWSLRRGAGGLIEVTIPSVAPRRVDGVIVHRTRRPIQCAVRSAIPVTTVARTLLDCAGSSNPRQMRNLLEAAEREGLLDVDAVEAVRALNPGRANASLTAALELYRRDPDSDADHGLERAFLDLCEDFALRRPRVNALVEGLRVDFLWPEQRLIVETDGHRTHSTRRAFEEDRARDAALAAAGWRVVRFTYRQVMLEREKVAAILRRLLDPAAP